MTSSVENLNFSLCPFPSYKIRYSELNMICLICEEYSTIGITPVLSFRGKKICFSCAVHIFLTNSECQHQTNNFVSSHQGGPGICLAGCGRQTNNIVNVQIGGLKICCICLIIMFYNSDSINRLLTHCTAITEEE